MDFDIITDAMEANALGYENSYIDIYSSSWGPSDYGFSVERPGTLVQQIFATGVREVRHLIQPNFRFCQGCFTFCLLSPSCKPKAPD